MAAHWAQKAFRGEHWKDAHWYGAEVSGSGRGALVRGCVWIPGAALGETFHPGAIRGNAYTPGATLGKLVTE